MRGEKNARILCRAVALCQAAAEAKGLAGICICIVVDLLAHAVRHNTVAGEAAPLDNHTMFPHDFIGIRS